MRFKPARYRLTAILAVTLATSVNAWAQSAKESRSFPADYFSDFAPRTALDMAERVPGFSIPGGNNSGRGLGQGGGNVRINGARISGKSASPQDTLSRIPANTVLRLEILDGASLSIPGLSGDVINVTTKADTFSGTWEWQPELREKQSPNWLNGNIAASG